ncbi:MAG: hypothetical protein HOV77_02695 [Hamadaea sp.]|uniref:hypothetical protein n=1 Tax=Hamadaea sp. TaxID=2024425 RepID=UPI0017BE54C1|nr:hypothetical protein [Hamadaea sp.]NUT18067.1 hypothetical protein [Hamadaea sp.]
MTFKASKDGVLRFGTERFGTEPDEDPLASVCYLLDDFYDADDLDDPVAGIATAGRLLEELTQRALRKEGLLDPAEIDQLTITA